MKTIGIYQGKVKIIEYEDPQITDNDPHRVLVKVKYSAISTGTEIALLHDPNFPDGDTLGYSASGEVIDVGAKVTRVRKGDFVACYGSPYVYHAEMLSVPEILCIPIASAASLRECAFVGLGAIAMHSVRKLRLQFGETAWVMGLGIVGQYAAKLCELANYAVIATDYSANRVQIANKNGVSLAFSADDPKLEQAMKETTHGAGFNGIAICASTKESGIINECVKKLAHGGMIVVVGSANLNISQDLLFHKEAQITSSRAGGPGRYDEVYENQCLDYPQSYVRWTEGRNMQEFIRLVENGKFNAASYITHEFSFHEAPQVYSLLEEPNNQALGVVFSYD